MTKKTQAKCTKDMLTVGFHTASPPLVWRFDLERNHSFTLSLQGEEGDWELGVTSPKGEFYPVVHFDAREDAEDALTVVEKALSRKRGSASLLTKALAFVGILALLILGSVVIYGSIIDHQLSASQFSPSATSLDPSAMAPSMAAPATSAPDAEGVPLSADEVLKAPR
jgi:hypothetical protein